MKDDPIIQELRGIRKDIEEECKRKGFIRRTSVDGNLIKSLVEMSKISEKEEPLELHSFNICL